jgi:NADPH-dependent ferric siderophore reductase
MNTTATAPGRLSQTLIRMFMKQARVSAMESVAGGFHLITLQGSALKGVAWAPGQKIQIAMGSAFVSRTYTPIEWDAAQGSTRLLGYAHGNGPGSAWLGNLKVGDECAIFGPRASLDVGHISGLRVVLGDETSLGLIHTLARHSAGNPLQSLLEVASVDDVSRVRDRLNLHAVELFARTPDEEHLQGIEARLPVLAAAGASFILTGKATSIQRLQRALKAQGVPRSRLLTKAYWALGKTGLD